MNAHKNNFDSGDFLLRVDCIARTKREYLAFQQPILRSVGAPCLEYLKGNFAFKPFGCKFAGGLSCPSAFDQSIANRRNKVAVCLGVSKTIQRTKQPRQIVRYCSRDSASDEGEDLKGDGGLVKWIIKEGNGDSKPKVGDMVELLYTIWVDGTFISSNEDVTKPFSFQLGLDKSDAIPGWEAALLTMRRGERARLRCAPAYAFGAVGFPPRIPPNATSVSELELLRWTSPAARRIALAEKYTSSSAPESAAAERVRSEMAAGNFSRDLNLTRSGRRPKVYDLEDPSLRTITSRKQRVEGRLPGRYRWKETPLVMDVFLPVPEATRAPQVRCDILPRHLRVVLSPAGGGAETVLLEGPLVGRVDPRGSFWTLAEEAEGLCVHVSLIKAPSDHRIWDGVTVRAVEPPPA